MATVNIQLDEEIWSANEHIAEAEVNADIEQALREVRAENPARRP